MHGLFSLHDTLHLRSVNYIHPIISFQSFLLVKKHFCFLLLLAFAIHANASIDTTVIYSAAMHKDIKAVVIKPDNYDQSASRYPVVYLLHGYSGSYNNWVKKVPAMQQLVNDNQLIVVCPDGAFSSWYFDSPVDSSYKYETYVSKEVPQFVDANYRTIANRKSRAIAGLSMGGHGALFLAFRHAETFGACGSMSGALDISRVTKSYDIAKRLGDTITNRSYFIDWSVLNVIEKKSSDSLSIIIDCGVDDFVFDMNKAVHTKMLKLKIAHDYIERPGKHDWPYWGNAVAYQLLFFKRYFNGYR